MPATEDITSPAESPIESLVVLVDEQDNEIGTAEKLYAHQKGLLHRAFSIVVFRHQPHLELLLQQRADSKYHSSGLWTNTCCSHPHPGESIAHAATRRLKEEFSLVIPLTPIGQFHYIAHFSNGLTENEFDHVFIGSYNNEKIVPHPHEIKKYRWISLPDLHDELENHPERFTPWLEGVLKLLGQWYYQRYHQMSAIGK